MRVHSLVMEALDISLFRFLHSFAGRLGLVDLGLVFFARYVPYLLAVGGGIFAWRLWRDVPVGRWQAMLRDCLIGIAGISTAIAFVSSAAVTSLPAGWGGVVGYSVATLLRWAIGLIGDPTAILWTTRIVGGLIGLGGLLLWARGLTIEIPERARRLPRFDFRRSGNDAAPGRARKNGWPTCR